MSSALVIGSIATSTKSSLLTSTQAASSKVAQSNGVKFKGVLEKVANQVEGMGDFHKEMVQLTQQIQSGKQFSPHQLLLYQIRAGEFHVKTELVSKVAESMTTTVKKFQSGA